MFGNAQAQLTTIINNSKEVDAITHASYVLGVLDSEEEARNTADDDRKKAIETVISVFQQTVVMIMNECQQRYHGPFCRGLKLGEDSMGEGNADVPPDVGGSFKDGPVGAA